MQRAVGSAAASEVERRPIPKGSNAKYRLRNRSLGLRECAPPGTAPARALYRLGLALCAVVLQHRNALESGTVLLLEVFKQIVPRIWRHHVVEDDVLAMT